MARRVRSERQVSVRGAIAVALVLVLAYPLASPASDVATNAVKPVETPRDVARPSAPATQAATATDRYANPFAGLSNEQLADVADRWEGLNQDERRWFFVEVRRRLMATDGAPAIRLGASGRFGQVVRDRDGNVARMDTTVVPAQAAAPADARDDSRAYGLGFERRLEVQAAPEANPSPASVRLPARHQRPAKADGGT